MKLIKGNEIAEITNENVISAFKDSGWIEAVDQTPAVEDPKPKKRTKANK